MNDMSMVCQIISVYRLKIIHFFLVISVASCGFTKDKKSVEFNVEELPDFTARWFDGGGNYSFYDQAQRVKYHPFFDPTVSIKPKEKLVSFHVVNHAESNIFYQFDLVSGARFAKFPYCAQTDVWQNYNKPIKRSPFNSGVIPRVLNRLGKPQQIFVFGNDAYYLEKTHINHEFVRVVGALVLQECALGNCSGVRSWLTSMVIVAVDTRDKKYKNVHSLAGLKKIVDWNYVKAFIENGFGRNIIAANSYPGFRLAGEIYPLEAIKYLETQSTRFGLDKLDVIKKSCHQLYDFVWEHIGNFAKNEQTKFSPETLKKIKEYNESRLGAMTKVEREQNTTFSLKEYSLSNNMRLFLTLFKNEYATCIDYVKNSNINFDYSRHWFFTYFDGAFKLFQMDYYFNCKNKNWSVNPLDIKGRYLYSQVKELEQCKERDINVMFSSVPNVHRNLANSSVDYWTYIDYDNSSLGTHDKIYNWVKVSGKKLKCDKPLFKWPWQKKKVLIDNLQPFSFPDDVKWTPIESVNPKEVDKTIIR